jgi:hypothetical protein
MKGQFTQIIQIERIENERWYIQYLAQSRDYKKRLNRDTEKRLYHGCPDSTANLIIENCFDRSFAGKNGRFYSCFYRMYFCLAGTAYGVGVYFSSNPGYSHGDSSMKTRPLGFDSTTDTKHIFVTYHDAQAYAEYLITYK